MEAKDKAHLEQLAAEVEAAPLCTGDAGDKAPGAGSRCHAVFSGGRRQADSSGAGAGILPALRRKRAASNGSSLRH